MRKLITYLIIVVVGYAAFSMFFAQRIDTRFYSVVLSDGWELAKPIDVNGSTDTAVYVNKRTQTKVTVVASQKGIGTAISNAVSGIFQYGASLIDNKYQEKQGNGFTYFNITSDKNPGVVFKAGNDKSQVVIEISGPAYGDGIDFVNTFFKTDKTLFPKFSDPNAPGNSFNYVYFLRLFKTFVHEYISPKELFNKVS